MPMKKIMLVEDEDIARKVVADTLQRAGYEVDVFAEAPVALAALRDQKDEVALVILDWMMPVMDGMSFIRAMKAETILDHIPVVMLTAKDDHEAVVGVLEAGAVDYLNKPVRPEVLLELVAHWVQLGPR